jgi:hypothetical protein
MADEFRLFGNIALRSGLISQAQLTKALMLQESQKGISRKKIGHILWEMGVLKPADVRHILDVQALLRMPNPEHRFGGIAIMNEFVTPEQVMECLQMQSRNPGKRIGEIMVERGYITEEQKGGILKALKRLQGEDGKPGSRLVQAVCRVSKGGALTTERVAVIDTARAQILALIASGVKGMTHLGILSHIIHRQTSSYSVGDFAKALGEDRKEVQEALDDLVAGSILLVEKKLLRKRYVYTPDAQVRQRVELLMASVNDLKTRAEVLEHLLRKK